MPKLQLALYKKMYLIRETEDEIRREYYNDEMKTPMHMSRGGEAIAVGVCHALPQGSHVYGTYRSHALYLAWTEETDKFFAEMYGKSTGTARGKAGSMHLASPDHNLMATSAVVATTIPWALGDAYEAVYNKHNRLTAVFFGDGATDEGAFWESLNTACLMKLPLLLVCEDNKLAIQTSTEQRRGYNSLTNIVKHYRCDAFEGKGNDVEEIYSLANIAIDYIRKNNMPALLNLTYFRHLDHVGVNEDFKDGFRPTPETQELLLEDPVYQLRLKLVKAGYISAVEEIEKAIHGQVNVSRIKAQEAPFPDKNELMEGVFHGE